jgi:4-hydroxy-3-polyprenylbenzoate decarboxylase
LTQANAILGQGQLSLAKYLFIAAGDDDPYLDIHDIGAFLGHVLSRVDLTRDLHFQTRTTIDTLDYSGEGLNRGSKLVVAAAGPPVRSLSAQVPRDLRLPTGFSDPRVCVPGILVVRSPRFAAAAHGRSPDLMRFCGELQAGSPGGLGDGFPLVVLVDDSEMCARSLENFLWVTFTRSNPAVDTGGIGAEVVDKHWGCHGSLVIDARLKPHHAPPLVEDPAITQRVDALWARGGPLHGIQ